MSVTRFATLFSSFARVLLKPPAVRPALLAQQQRGSHDKDVLKLLCKDCYFKKVDDRWWVLCKSVMAHKQRQHVIDTRVKWIVTHLTIGHRPFQKKEEAYICNTCPPGAYDYKRKIVYRTEERLPAKLRAGHHRKFFVPPYNYDKLRV